MKFPTWLLTILFIFGGGLIGLIIALNTFPEPKWDKLVILSKQNDVIKILFVDHHDAEKVENDVIYVATKSGNVYSILHNEWSLLPALPNGEIINKIGFNVDDSNRSIVATTKENKFYQLNDTKWELINDYEEFHWSNEFDQCAITEEWRHTPPVEAGVIDSTGVVFEHTISGFFKCFVLYEDGHLEIWSHKASSLEGMGIAQTNCMIGVISGSILSLVIWLYRKFRYAKELS
jgi:hypothetical protein